MDFVNSKNILLSKFILKKLIKSTKVIPSLKIWSRSFLISSEILGLRLKVHNGKDFVPLVITEEMIGHKIGEFVFTRAKYEFKKKKKKKK